MWTFSPVQASSRLHLPLIHGKLVRPSFQTANCVSFLPLFLLEIEFSGYLGATTKKIWSLSSRELSKQIPPPPSSYQQAPTRGNLKRAMAAWTQKTSPIGRPLLSNPPSASCFTCKVWHNHGTSALLEPKQRFSQSGPLCAFFNPSCEYLSFNWASIQ